MTRTFQGYVEHLSDTVLGLGTSAISSTPRMYWQNHAKLPAWEAAIAAGELPVHRGFVLDRDDQIRRAVIGRLMCDGRADLAALGREHELDPADYFARELAALSTVGELASYDPVAQVITTTALGKLLVRNVCMLFDRYQGGAVEQARYSSTI